MSSQKISQFTPITVLASGDYFPVVQASGLTNKRVDVGVLDVRFTAAASGVAAQDTANNALASGNLAIASGIAAQDTANTALASGNAALVTLIPKSFVDAKGDILTATANDTPARLPVGTNGYFLSANSSTSTGLEWSPVSSDYVLLSGVAGSPSVSIIQYTVPSGYQSIVVEGSNIKSNGYVAAVRFKSGASTLTGTNYQYSNWEPTGGTTTFVGNASLSASSVLINGNTGNSYASYGYSFRLNMVGFWQPNTYVGPICTYSSVGVNQSSTRTYSTGNGLYFDATPRTIDGFVIQDTSGGGYLNGNIYIYGKKAN